MMLLALSLSAGVHAQSSNVNMRVSSASGKQVALPTAGKKTDAVLSQTTMLVDGKIYPFMGFSYVSCVGDSATGTVRVTVEAVAKNDAVTVQFGVNCGENACIRAVDEKGHLFEGTCIDTNQGQALPMNEPVSYVFEFENVPIGLELFKFVKAEYEMHDGATVYNSQECNPVGVKHARIVWKNQ